MSRYVKLMDQEEEVAQVVLSYLHVIHNDPSDSVHNDPLCIRKIPDSSCFWNFKSL